LLQCDVSCALSYHLGSIGYCFGRLVALQKRSRSRATLLKILVKV
jgi:hypothetical protein